MKQNDEFQSHSSRLGSFAKVDSENRTERSKRHFCLMLG